MRRLNFHFAVLAAMLAPSFAVAAEAKHPDVLFLVLEDVSPERFGAYGNKVCKTPNIDRLASQGVRFDRFYTTPPCCPSRTSLLSGLRPETTKVFDNSDARLAKPLFERLTILPEQFQQGGYETVRIGKIAHDDYKKTAWTRIANRGEGRESDESDGGNNKSKPHELPPQGPHADPKAKFTGARFIYGPTGLPDKEHDDYHTAGAAIAALQENREKPLFLAVGFHADHLAFRAPDAYFAMYPAEAMTIPQNPGAGADGLPTPKTLRQIREVSGFNAAGFNNPATLQQWREAIAAQYACLTFVDAQIGRILTVLDEAGRADDTIVVVWSDHGFMLGEHFMWRKGLLYDANCKCACIVRAPGVAKPGAVCGRIVETPDLFPTMLELAGLPAAKHVEAVSFAPLLRDPELPWKKGSLIYRDKGRSVGLVTERWRLNRFADHPDRDALYDHETDPAENVNLIGDSQHAAVVKELDALIAGGWKACLPETNR